MSATLPATLPELFADLEGQLAEARDYVLDAVHSTGEISTDALLHGVAHVRRSILLVEELRSALKPVEQVRKELDELETEMQTKPDGAPAGGSEIRNMASALATKARSQ